MAEAYISDLIAAAALDGSELLEVSQLSGTVTIAAATISAEATDNSFNDSGSGFVAAGFAVGNRVRVQGFTGDVANNLFVGVVTALTTAKMTIGGTDGDVIADDAAGETVTITKWVTRRASVAEIAASPVEEISGTTYDLLDTDAGKYLRCTNASAKTVTVRDEADHALPANGEWHFRNAGAGDLTFAEDTAVTINPPVDGTLVVAEGGAVTLKRIDDDEFDLIGVTVPA